MRDHESTNVEAAAYLARDDAPRADLRPRVRCGCYTDPVSGPEVCAACERAAEEATDA